MTDLHVLIYFDGFYRENQDSMLNEALIFKLNKSWKNM